MNFWNNVKLIEYIVIITTFMKRSPSMKGSRVSSAQNNNSVAISEDKPPTPKTKFNRMKNYAEEQKNISKR